MLIAYSKKHATEVFIETVNENGVVASPVRSEQGEKILTTIEDLEVTGKLPQSDSEDTAKLRTGDAQVTAKILAGYGEDTPHGKENTTGLRESERNGDRLAEVRKLLPAQVSPLDELESKWAFVACLMNDALYKDSQSARSFKELVRMLGSGELKNVPKPVYRAAESLCASNHSLKFYNRLVMLYAQYNQDNRTKGWFAWIDFLLERTDRLLTKIVS